MRALYFELALLQQEILASEPNCHFMTALLPTLKWFSGQVDGGLSDDGSLSAVGLTLSKWILRSQRAFETRLLDSFILQTPT